MNPFSAVGDKQAEPEKKKQQPEVYGPPQVIYRIDEDRYFTLEAYTRCENGKTFYNNKAKGIHTQIAPLQVIYLKEDYFGYQPGMTI
nr:hypothetical protein [Pantoea sp. 201603H]